MCCCKGEKELQGGMALGKEAALVIIMFVFFYFLFLLFEKGGKGGN